MAVARAEVRTRRGATRYVAFLRAINVGGHVVKMDRLRGLFEELKLANVETFIASGNVLFDSSAKPERLESQIETHLEKHLGYAAETFLRSAAEIAALAAFEPFPEFVGLPAPARRHVGFLKCAPTPVAARTIEQRRDGMSEYRFVGREAHWFCRVPQNELKPERPTFEQIIAGPATFRNFNTVRRLAERLRAAE